MLVYNPAFDIHHGIFRILQILIKIYPNPIEVDKLLILDFYLLFPNKLHNVRLTRELRLLVNSVITPDENPYNKVGNAKSLFQQIHNYQLSSLNCLAAYGLIDNDKLSSDLVQLNYELLSGAVKDIVNDQYLKEKGLIDFLTQYLFKIELKKVDGLKYRTGLLEYRYDV